MPFASLFMQWASPSSAPYTKSASVMLYHASLHVRRVPTSNESLSTTAFWNMKGPRHSPNLPYFKGLVNGLRHILSMWNIVSIFTIWTDHFSKIFCANCCFYFQLACILHTAYSFFIFGLVSLPVINIWLLFIFRFPLCLSCRKLKFLGFCFNT